MLLKKIIKGLMLAWKENIVDIYKNNSAPDYDVKLPKLRWYIYTEPARIIRQNFSPGGLHLDGTQEPIFFGTHILTHLERICKKKIL